MIERLFDIIDYFELGGRLNVTTAVKLGALKLVST